MKKTLLTDFEFANLLKSNDEKGLSYVFNLHSRALIYFANKMINDLDEAEDIVVKCFYKFWEKRSDFTSQNEAKAFLYISCKNSSLNYLRGVKRKSNAETSFFEMADQSEDSILTKIVETEYLHILNEEIETLPSKMQEVFKMIYFDGLKTDEVAKKLGLSVKTVRNQKSKAIEILKSSILKRGLSPLLLLAIHLFLQEK